MHKYKVAVYAICKNEEKFIKRWVSSMKEADDIYVLDTGSKDQSIKLLKEEKVHVTSKKIEPFRFDIARNESLKLVPKDVDICVCTDIDEVFNPGWRDKLENIWNGNRIKYNYNWAISEDNKILISYYLDKIHSRNGHKWKYPVHEVLIGNNNNITTTNDITLNHYPDKNKSRKSYLPLLELATKEFKADPRCLHYLGREYMYYNKNNKAISTLKKHLNLKNSTWKEERSASMRFIGRCYARKKDFPSSIKWYDLSIKEAPHLRDPYVEKALIMYNQNKYNDVIYLCEQALDIKQNKKEYINETFSYDETIYDLLSLCYYYKGNNELALFYINKALLINPTNERLKENKSFFK